MVDCPLREMTLIGFRSIDLQKVEFSNPIFVVGRNGSGKSNFADAFAFRGRSASGRRSTATS